MEQILDRLEKKTRRLVETLEELRRDNERLQREMEEVRGDSGDEEKISLLEEERHLVRGRVEKLISLLEETP